MPPPDAGTPPSVTIHTLAFRDGSTLTCEPSDVIVVVGPNNAGKSALLRGIRDKLALPTAASPVLSSLSVQKTGSLEDFMEWAESWSKRQPGNDENPLYAAVGASIHASHITHHWQSAENALGPITRWFCHFLSADERLGISTPPESVSLTQHGPRHPIHYLQRDDGVEAELSSRFRKAFAVDLIVHRNAGATVPLHVGERPEPRRGEDRVSMSYIERLEQLPPLHTQGDGMRSFAGVLLATSVGRESILLVDEPEAFLHPPQAKWLGTFLIEGRRPNCQMFIATHSSDVLRGVLDAHSKSVTVLRIQREGSSASISTLTNDRVNALWNDPLLRHSNILDGLFHDAVVVCESDGDCRFYSAMIDAERSASGKKGPDLLFLHCGGKARIPAVARALREVGVPVHAIADFDVLAEKHTLLPIVEALGLHWSDIERDWTIVKSALDSKRSERKASDVKREIEESLAGVSGEEFPDDVRKKIQISLKRSTAWGDAKSVGKPYVPSGDPTRACEQLLEALSVGGLHVVPVGELEGFCRPAGGHGPKWVTEVLSMNLLHAPALEEARRFVGSILQRVRERLGC